MKKVIIFALIVGILSVAAFAASVDLVLNISNGVKLEMGPISGTWDWTDPVNTTVESLGAITTPVTIYANCSFILTGSLSSPYIIGDSTKGVEVVPTMNWPDPAGSVISALGTDEGPYSYSDLVTYGGLSTGKAESTIYFNLVTVGGFQWYEVEAAGEHKVVYTATIAAN